MKLNAIFWTFFLPLFYSEAFGFGLFSNYQDKTPQENIETLTQKQAKDPVDPYTNYNLGVANYNANNFEHAINNFDRAALHTKNISLKKMALFNLANSHYKNALAQLLSDWEKKETQIPPEALIQAISNTQTAIKSYKNLLELDQNHQRAPTNLKQAEQLLEKLLKKQQKQPKQNQDKKEPQQKQDKDQQKQQQEQQKQDQQKQQQDKQNEQDKQNQQDKQDKQDKQDQEQQKQSDQGEKQNQSDQKSG
ncbi:MAG: hypothetical protein V1855_03180, partial [bacterium]